MNKDFNEFVNKLLKDLQGLKVVRNYKKGKIIVYDFMIKIEFGINSSPLTNCKICGQFKECDYKKCKHIYAVITHQNGYNLGYNLKDIYYLWKNNNFSKLCITESNSNHSNLNTNYNFDYTPDECIFCLQKIKFNENGMFISQCLNCGICYHDKCHRRYDKQECINCKEQKFKEM